MKLQSKIILAVMPLVLASIVILGVWSYLEARTGIQHAVTHYLETILDAFVSEHLTRANQILEKNKLTTIQSFVDDYKRRAIDASRKITPDTNGHFFALDPSGRIVFCSLGHNKQSMEAKWEDIAKNASHSLRKKIQGQMTGESGDEVFVARYFAPWKWTVFLAIPKEQAFASLTRIRNVTIVIALFCGIVSIGLIFLVLRHFFVAPLIKLKSIAGRIADGDLRTPLRTPSGKDEINQLALSLEKMRGSLNDLFERTKKTEELARLNTLLEQEVVERSQIEENLRLERDRVQQYLDIAGVMIVAIGRDQKVRLINKRGCEILGYSEDEIIGQNWFDNFLPKEVYIQVKQVFDGLIKGETNLVNFYENEVITKSGQRRIVSWHNALITDESNNIVGTLSSGEDISERRRAEEEKELVEEQLRQAQKMEAVGTLAGGIAHDFNNILSAIIGYTELTLDDLGGASSVRENLEEVLKSSWRARNLVSQLLAYSRKQVLEMKTFTLNDLIKQNQSMLRRIIGEDIDLKITLAPDLSFVRADFNQTEQILLNLVANARDAMPNGGKLTIETANVHLDENYVATHPDIEPGPYVMLAVSDNGPGIEEKNLGQIFDPFFTTKETGKGTGMGLATVQGIVKQHQGSAYVYSELGHGTSFKIYLPIVEEEPEVIVERAEISDLVSGTETILIVEDESVVREFVAKTLGRLGYRVLTAEHGPAALDVMRELGDQVDLLLTDVIMPKMNGKELYKRLSMEKPGLKVLYISGYTDNVIAHHGVLDAGVAFLQKPLSIAAIAKKLRQVLDA